MYVVNSTYSIRLYDADLFLILFFFQVYSSDYNLPMTLNIAQPCRVVQYKLTLEADLDLSHLLYSFCTNSFKEHFILHHLN